MLLLGCRAGICHQVFEAVAAFFTGLHTHTHTLPGTTTAGPDAKFPSVPKGWKGTNSPWLFWTANCVQFRNRGHLKAVYIAFNSQRGSIKFHLQHLQDIFSKNLSPHCYYVAPHCLSMSCAFRINSFRLRSLDRAQEILQLILDSGVSLSLFQRSRFCPRCVGSWKPDDELRVKGRSNIWKRTYFMYNTPHSFQGWGFCSWHLFILAMSLDTCPCCEFGVCWPLPGWRSQPPAGWFSIRCPGRVPYYWILCGYTFHRKLRSMPYGSHDFLLRFRDADFTSHNAVIAPEPPKQLGTVLGHWFVCCKSWTSTTTLSLECSGVKQFQQHVGIHQLHLDLTGNG